MTLPLYMFDAFGYPTALVIATLLGFGFGFVLERAGFGRASVLAAQFYLSDMRVLKVMFSAIVTALIGMTLLAGVGILDLSRLQVPDTFLWPQLVGGFLLGIGFIVSGYCPGTGVVAMASGKFDGLAAILGVMGGSVIFGFVYPDLADFYLSGALGPLRLPELLGLPQSVLALGVAVMAIGAFVGAEALERLMAGKRGEAAPLSPRAIRRRAFAGIAMAASFGIVTLLVPARGGTHASAPRVSSIEPIELAQLIIERPTSVFLVDLRGPAACAEARIPGALCPDDPELEFLATLPPTRELVLYGEGDLETLPAAAGSFEGRVRILRGGYRGFTAAVLTAPDPADASTRRELDAYRLRAALHAYFTGSTPIRSEPTIQPRVIHRRPARKGGGC